jgi:hypothetical protein
VIVTGTPEEVAECEESVTGRILKREFARDVAIGDKMDKESLTPRRKGAKKK